VLNIAVFGSGRGTNAQSILENIDRGCIRARISVVISNKSDAGIFTIADTWRIPRQYINPLDYGTEEEYTNKLLLVLDEHDIGLIVLAGYLKKISSTIISRYRNRIMNIHPALLPAFGGAGMYGMRVHRSVIEYGVKITGVTVHFVDEEYDRGPIIVQEAVKVYDSDTPQTLAQRVLSVEHKLYPEAIASFAENRLRIDNRRVYIEK
jgi:phosphoribosylglycinamide formyltransferase 1